jgi:hypothetical protein
MIVGDDLDLGKGLGVRPAQYGNGFVNESQTSEA